jgi:hypothetical protein
LDEYAKCFQHPLSQPQIQVLAALFGWGLPVVEDDRLLVEGC